MANGILSRLSLDPLHRTPEQIEADNWFMRKYQEARRATMGSEYSDAQYRYNAIGGEAVIVRKTPDGPKETKLLVPAGLYNMEALTAFLQKEGSKKSLSKGLNEKIKNFRVERVVAATAENEGFLGDTQRFPVIVDAHGWTTGPSDAMPLAGTVINLQQKGLQRYDALEDASMYRAALPFLLGAWIHANHWCIDLPCEEVADMANHAQEMLANLRAQLKYVGGVEVYTVVPVWLRYYSDGSIGTQRSGAFGIRNTHYPSGHSLAPLLYDSPAWKVGLRFGGRLLGGRVFVTPEGKFIGSDWCQREVDKSGGIDLHTGEFTKHTLMTWAAGPGISRFGNVRSNSYGEVRRARLTNLPGSSQAKAKHEGLIELGVIAQKIWAAPHKYLELVDKAQDLTKNDKGLASLRIAIPDMKALSGANAGNAALWWQHKKAFPRIFFMADIRSKAVGYCASALGFPIVNGKAVIKAGNGAISSEFYPRNPSSYTRIKHFWQYTTPDMTVYRMTDEELARRVLRALWMATADHQINHGVEL